VRFWKSAINLNVKGGATEAEAKESMPPCEAKASVWCLTRKDGAETKLHCFAEKESCLSQCIGGGSPQDEESSSPPGQSGCAPLP